jgi:phosphoglycerate kinase
MEVADYLLIGGGMANTFLAAQGFEVGKSFNEYEQEENARRILFDAAQKHTTIMLPSDVVIGDPNLSMNPGIIKKVSEVSKEDQILDLGPETQARFGAVINKAKTIVWNGPVGLFENPEFRRGTDFIYYSIAHNTDAISIVGGGDTLSAISKKEYLEKITHISTGGGAMLEYIEQGTLPGIEALKK